MRFSRHCNIGRFSFAAGAFDGIVTLAGSSGTWTLTSDAEPAGLAVAVPKSSFAFCTQADGSFYGIPSATPTISPKPSPAPTGVPIPAPSPRPTTATPTGAPAPAPSAAPSPSPTPAPSRVPTPFPSFDDCNVADGAGGWDRSELFRYDADNAGVSFSLYNATNGTTPVKDVNSGALDAAVADYAVSYGVADFSVAAPPQVVATTYDVVSVPTPDWLTPSPTLPPTPSPSTTFAPTRPPSVPYRGKKAAGAEADGRFWLIFLLAAIAVAAVAFGFTYLFMHVMLERGLKARGARTKKPTAQGTVVPYMVSDGPATPKTPKVVETEAAREKRDALAESRGAALGRLGSVRELRVAPGGAPRRASDLPDVPVPTSILPTRAQYEATQHAIDDLSEDQLASLILKKPPAKPKHGDFGLTDANQPVHHLAVSKTDSAWARKAHLPPIESAATQDEPLSPKLEILGSSRAEKVSPRLRLAPIDDRGTEESKGHRGDDADDPAPPTYQPALGRNFSAKRGDLESGRAPKK